MVIGHFGADLPVKLIFGGEAVLAFYVISGFYISLVLNEKYAGIKNSFSLYLTNRLFRILPLYWFSLLCVTLINESRAGFHGLYQWLPGVALLEINIKTWLLFLFSHIFILGQDLLCFAGMDMQTRL